MIIIVIMNVIYFMIETGMMMKNEKEKCRFFKTIKSCNEHSRKQLIRNENVFQLLIYICCF